MNWKLFLYITLGFIAATVVGTLSHESGHYLAALINGCSPELHYGSVSYHCERQLSWNYSMFLTASGPFQTMITGLIGFMLLRRSTNNTTTSDLTFIQWIFVFLALFPLRQLFNLGFEIVYFLQTGNMGNSSDELRLDRMLEIEKGTISFLLAGLSAILIYHVIFRYIPSKNRLTFILGGLTGGILGFLLWLKYLGKFILP